MAPPAPKVSVARCPVPLCKIRLDGPNLNTKCAKCALKVCSNHIFPSDHDCNPVAAPKPAGTLIVAKKNEPGSVAPATVKAADFPSLKVVKNEKTLEKASEPVAAPQAKLEVKTTALPTTIQDDSPETLASEFVLACTKNRIGRIEECGKLLRALEAYAQDPVKLAMGILEPARSAFGRVAISTHAKEALAALEKNLFENGEESSPRAWLAFGMLVSRVKSEDSELFDALDRCASPSGLGKIKDPQPWVGLAFAEALRFRRNDSSPTLGENPRVKSLAVDKLLPASKTGARVQSLALAGVLAGVGAPQSLVDLKINLTAENSATTFGLEQALAEVCGRDVEPFVFQWTGSYGELLYTKYTKGEPETRTRALAAGKAIARFSLGPLGVDNWVVNLVKNLKESTSWRGKEYALEIIETLASAKPDMLHDHLPRVVPELASCVVEAKKEVSVKASLALDTVGNSVTNPETKRLMPFILDAIKRPDEGTDRCLTELMDATFVNSLNATSVALIVPVVTRALREGSADLKRRGAVSTGNVCNLVRDVDDVRPFATVLRTELDKLTQNANPAVRKAAESALESLVKALTPANGTLSPRAQGLKSKDIVAREQEAQVMAAKSAKEIVDELTERGVLPTGSADATNFSNAALSGLLVKLMTMPVGEVSLKFIKSEIAVLFGFLNSQDKEAGVVADATFARVCKVRSTSFDLMESLSGPGQGDQDEVLVDIKDLILAYASRVLLSKTRVTLKKGHRYGVVGKIGVGKTTFASRLAKGDIEGFPENVSSYMVLHELAQDAMGMTVLQYMGGDDIALEKIKEVGFRDPHVGVSTLSGGWRMRLFIAKSMLANADLIVLDEPTCHVDVAGVKWLADYLKSLVKIGTTCVVVSHDYEFLADVATDVLHINSQRLDSFKGSFDEFQKAYPEIAAALPKMDATPTPSRTATPAVAGMAPGSEDGISREPTPSFENSPTPVPEGDGGNAIFDLLMRNETNPEIAAQLLASRDIPIIVFPDPGKLEGITSKGKPIMTASHVTYAYPSAPDRTILKDVSCKLSLNSRVALRGANGQGKSTLLKLMVGELALDETSKGSVWKHHNLRVSYVAQHAHHHLIASLDITPIAYLQRRYYEGRDKERSQMITLALDDEDQRVMTEKGEICGILSRVTRGKQLFYEIEIAGRRKIGEGGDGRASRSQRMDESSNAKEFRSLAQLEGMKKPHVIKLIHMFDEEMKYEASGMSIRPVTAVELSKHLNDFGIPDDFADRKIRWLSNGQKSRLVLAAAMWHKPHLIALDEPTNFLDAETLAVLTYSLRTFKGAVLTVSHDESFVRVLCNEAWDMENGIMTQRILKEKYKVGTAIGPASTLKDEDEE